MQSGTWESIQSLISGPGHSRRKLSRPDSIAAEVLEQRLLLSATVHLKATLSGASRDRAGDDRAPETETGTARFDQTRNDGQFRQELRIRVQKLAPNSQFDVSVDGVFLAQIFTNKRGGGKLIFQSHGDRHRPLPSAWPGLQADSNITIDTTDSGGTPADTPLSGTFFGRGSSTVRVDEKVKTDVGVPPDPVPPTLKQPVRWKLNGPGTVTGSAKYKEKLRNDVLQLKFAVSFKNGAADTSYDVLVGGVVVDQITTDAKGNGSLSLEIADAASSTFPDVTTRTLVSLRLTPVTG